MLHSKSSRRRSNNYFRCMPLLDLVMTLKQVPLAFALMSKKRSKDYEKVFECLCDHLPRGIALKQAVCDFEAGIWKGLRRVYGHTKLQGCAFHWTQAVFKKVKTLGLEPAYTNDDATFKLVRKLLALPFMPTNKIVPLFQELKDAHSTTQELTELFVYVEATWMTSSVWTVADWSVFGRAVRTNNDVEGWHNRINSSAGRGDLQLYVLLPFLYQESELVSIQVRLVSEGKLTRIQRKTTKETQRKIFTLWGDYQNGEMDERQLLRRLSRVNGPVRD